MGGRGHLSATEVRHNQAVAQSLAWAHAAAARGEYADALGWLEVLEAVGYALSSDEQSDRRLWLLRVQPDAGDASPRVGTGARSDSRSNSPGTPLLGALDGVAARI